MDEEDARKEFILNILLLGVVFLSAIAVVSAKVTFSQALQRGSVYKGLPGEIVAAIALIFLAFYFFSRAGLHRQVSILFIAVFLLPALYTSYIWGADVPQALLVYALVIVIAGILVSTKFAFIMTIFISTSLLVISYLQIQGSILVNSLWRNQPPHIMDTGVFLATLIIVAVVSWLFNREIEKALRRARGSEKALKKERDMLEVKVEERTKELKKAHLEKMFHLYRFADFGRLASGLFHDLVNPLTTVSLNLEQLQTKGFGARQRKLNNDAKKLVGRAVSGTKQMRKFVNSIKKQIQKQEVKTNFILCEEIKQAIDILDHKANEAKVKIHFVRETKVRNFGNPIRFNQLVTNLVSNAIDSYQKVRRRKNREVMARLAKKKNRAILTVQDFGSGIPKKNLNKLFDPFFTTKSIEQGTGLGLSICKDIVEKEFGGKIKVESKEGDGCTFTVEFPLKKRF